MSKTAVVEGILIAVVSALLITAFSYLIKVPKIIYRFLLKLRIRYLPMRFVMALAIHNNQASHSGSYYKEIKRILLEEFDKGGLSKIVTVQDFSDLHLFRNRDEAENFQNSKDIDLIVWGQFVGDSLKKNGEVVCIFNPNFTYSYSYGENNKKEIEDFIAINIAQIQSLKNYWQIRENNSLTDVDVLANNLFVLTTFIIGLTVVTRGNIDLGGIIFEKAYQKLTIQNDPAASLLIPHLVKCYSFATSKALRNRDYTKAKDFSIKILSLDDKNHAALSTLALSQYKMGQLQDSKTTIQKLRDFYPNNAITKMDGAFMDMLEGKYKQALQKYKKVCQLSASKIDFSPQESIEFLFKEYEKTKEPALMYASGVLALYLAGDTSLAKKDLSTFLEKGSSKKHGVMYSDAEKIISQLNS